ncbi:MAG: hypothetical protein ACRC62_17200 [Microcoleus sp.]
MADKMDSRISDYEDIKSRLLAEIGDSALSYRITVEKQEKFIKEQQEDWTILAEAVHEGKEYGYPPSRPVIQLPPVD